MILKKLKTTLVPHIEGVDISENYLALFTGQRAVVLNRKLEIIHDIRNLKYIYDGRISPDEKRLLLTGTGSNIMLYSFENEDIYDKITLRKPYNGNISGRAIWSRDGEKIFVLPMNVETTTNIVRIFEADNLKKHKDIDILNYLMYDIIHIENDQYAVLAYKRETECYYIILFDSQKTKIMQLSRFDNRMIQDVNYDYVTELFELDGWSEIIYVEKNSKASLKPTIPNELTVRENIRKITDDVNKSNYYFEYLKEVNLLEKTLIDGLKKITLSKNGKYIFVVTNMELIVLSTEKREILQKEKIDLSAKGFQEFDDGVLIATSKEQLFMYKLVEE